MARGRPPLGTDLPPLRGRCVLCRDGRAVPLSFDHKPQLPSELRRIQRAGSFVFRGRVQGVLALSRAIGDFSFKQRRRIYPFEGRLLRGALRRN